MDIAFEMLEVSKHKLSRVKPSRSSFLDKIKYRLGSNSLPSQFSLICADADGLPLKDNSVDALLEFIEYIKAKNIELLEVNYSNQKIEIEVSSYKKEQLLKLLEFSKRKVKLQSLAFDENLNLHCMKVILHG